MPQKLPTFKEYLNKELKDKEFRKLYEKEGKSIKKRIHYTDGPIGKVKIIKDFLPRGGLKIIGKKLVPNSKKIFSNKNEALVLEDEIIFHGAKVTVDVHNMYKSRLLSSKINIADERSVTLTERGIKCSVDQRMVRINWDGNKKKSGPPPYGAFVWELSKETLRKFPVLFEFDRNNRLLGIMLLK
jgi:hypothetical protein